MNDYEKAKLHVGFVNTHPIQYYAPLYRALNETDEFRISAFYMSDFSLRGGLDVGFQRTFAWDVDLLSGYNAKFLKGAERRGPATTLLSCWAPSIWPEVRGAGLDALVVHGHTPAAKLLAIAAAKSAGIPVFIRGDTHLGLSRGHMKRLVRRPLMSTLYRILDGVLAIGSANADFYRAMGVPDERIFSMPYCIDNDRYQQVSIREKSQSSGVRATLCADRGIPIVLFAAKFQPRKRAADLILAADQLFKEGNKFHLALIGSGEQEQELRTLVASHNLNNVSFHGFINQAEMPQVYAASDVFVLPSVDEPWGLAVNEAMCAGLPIVLSEEVGCARDLVKHGVNGFTFRGGDVVGLAEALRPLIKSEEVRLAMGAKSRNLISSWSFSQCRDGLREAILTTRRMKLV